ncbi:hypothetical protein THRCLA_23061 [Thraustotheca clavata]|uniref:Uncharacterized protein n=1 Tax=Thraustotheca clavata TaxID=74557 RepID=A0A1V9YHA1_9STRA|nr:hypothetical protein THRCLA_23061 [Thraustotheca clavata]
MQGNYDHYNWILPDNPVVFIKQSAFYVALCTMDYYTWVRSLLGMSVAFNIAVNMVVALVIVINSWLCHHEVWVPDFYPSIQRRIQLRSLMLIIVTYSNNWWHVFEYALQKGNARTGWNEGFVLDEMIRSDCLTFLLSIALTLADLYIQRLGLDILMFIYKMCWSCQDDLVSIIGWDIEITDAYLAASYISCIITPEVGNSMSLWIYHEI